MKDKEEFICKKNWEDFRKTGLLWFTNTILQILGWSLVVNIDKKTNEIIDAYPARNKFKGFSQNAIKENGKKLMNYFIENAENIKNDYDL